ncbi:MAG TPA: methyltransferase [Acidobacteriaceae bacterium]|nr:methyltransferase [Acidobacteriaceae bacterium]
MEQPGIGNVAPNAALVQMAMSYSRSRMVCAAARLGVADALGDEARSVDEVADRCRADADAHYRLLRALASIGLTEETAPRQFRLTPVGRPLRRDVPESVWAAVAFWADLLADDWSLLTECVRAGKPAGEARPAGVPSRWSQEPEGYAIFRAVMGTASAEDYAPIAKTCDFSRAKVVADPGGGRGALILAVVELCPKVRGMLVDLEASIEAAKPRFAGNSRCELVAADLTESVPSGADVCLLKQVLHGCKDAAAVGILKNCRAVMPENGALLIIEFLLPVRVAGADPQLELRLMSDLNMLAVTGGRERSEPEWNKLLETAGFRLAGVFPAGSEMGIVG